MQQLDCRQDSRDGASVPCYMLIQWASLYRELLFRQEQKLQERLHNDDGGGGGVYSLHKPNRASILAAERGGGHEGKGLSSDGNLAQ